MGGRAVAAVAFDVNETLFSWTDSDPPSPAWASTHDPCRCGSPEYCETGRRAGLRTGRVARLSPTQPAHFLPADVVGPDLTTVVRCLLV